MDEVKDMGRLIRDTRRALKASDGRAEITRVTHILVASSFYYERTSQPVLGADGVFSCAGKTTERAPHQTVLIVVHRSDLLQI
jgi:hypothetical protein